MARVLVVGRGAPERGGIPTYLETVLRSGLTERHELVFCNLAQPQGTRGGRLGLHNLRRTARDSRWVWRGSRRGGVVHVHTALAPAVTALRAGVLAAAARLRGSTVIVHAHGGLVLHQMDAPLTRAAVRLALVAAHRVVAVSSAVSAALTALTGRTVLLLDNGVDVARYSGPTRGGDPPRLLYVGVLSPRKGVLDLLDACRVLEERGVSHRLVLVGGTPHDGAEGEQAVRAALPDTVELRGECRPEDMPAVYRGADLLCLPSWWEAMPLSVLEAMATGLPVVATDVGDVRRAVVHGTTGYLVPPRSPLALADALEALLTDAERRHRFGAAGRAHVHRHFSEDVLVEHLDRLYASLSAGGEA